MRTDLSSFEQQLSVYFDRTVVLAMVRQPLKESELSASGRRRLAALRSSIRRHQWLLGRAALQSVSARLHLDLDPCAIELPCASMSLTHKPDIAFAVGMENVTGVGIDYEDWQRSLNTGIERMFLDEDERQLLDGSNKKQLLRLWTIKEAAYKANLCNKGSVLRDYKLSDMTSQTGASHYNARHQQVESRYFSNELEEGIVTIAATLSDHHTKQPPLSHY